MQLEGAMASGSSGRGGVDGAAPPPPAANRDTPNAIQPKHERFIDAVSVEARPPGLRSTYCRAERYAHLDYLPAGHQPLLRVVLAAITGWAAPADSTASAQRRWAFPAGDQLVAARPGCCRQTNAPEGHSRLESASRSKRGANSRATRRELPSLSWARKPEGQGASSWPPPGRLSGPGFPPLSVRDCFLCRLFVLAFEFGCSFVSLVSCHLLDRFVRMLIFVRLGSGEDSIRGCVLTRPTGWSGLSELHLMSC